MTRWVVLAREPDYNEGNGVDNECSQRMAGRQ